MPLYLYELLVLLTLFFCLFLKKVGCSFWVCRDVRTQTQIHDMHSLRPDFTIRSLPVLMIRSKAVPALIGKASQ